jgi:hypothetical protein
MKPLEQTAMETSGSTAAKLKGRRPEAVSGIDSVELPTPPATSSPEPISEVLYLLNTMAIN